jgi:DNA polymerase IV
MVRAAVVQCSAPESRLVFVLFLFYFLLMRVASSLRWLFLDLNSYFASVEQQLNPALRGRPVAVAPVDSDATCAIAASYEAKAFGIKTGTPIYEARKLCPGLVVVNARHNRYVEFHHRILAAIETEIPVTRICSIDEVACALMDNEIQPEVAMALARRVKAAVQRDVGEMLRSSVGLAPNVFLAKLASNMQKPDGLTVILPDHIQAMVTRCTLRDLPGIGANMHTRLLRANVPDVQTLWNLAPKQARAIWGSIAGERLWLELHGYDIAVAPTQRRTIGHSHMLAPNLRDAESARQVVRRLLAKAASRLRRLDHNATRLTLSVRVDHGERLTVEAGFAATRDTILLLRAFNGLWDNIRQQAPKQPRFKKVAVTLHGLSPASAVQLDLFADKPAQSAAQLKLSGALDTLNARYGKDTVNYGLWNSQDVNKYTGTKIAFTRIPDAAEFHE